MGWSGLSFGKHSPTVFAVSFVKLELFSQVRPSFVEHVYFPTVNPGPDL